MTDYLPLLSRAVAALPQNSGEARRNVYERARQALVKQLRAMHPPLAEAEITRERLALEDAIRRIEGRSGRPEPAGARPAQPPPREARANAQAAAAVEPQPKPEPAAEHARVLRDAVSEAQQLDEPAPRERPGRDPFAPSPLGVPAADDRFAPQVDADDAASRAEDRIMPPGEPLQPRGRPGRGIDFAKADARRALKAKMIVGGIVSGVLLIAVVIGIVHWERILASVGLADPPARALVGDPGAAAPAGDRLPPSDTQARVPTGVQPGSAPVAAVAQRAVLYEENPGAGEQQLQTFIGTSVWKTETVSPGPGRPPELGVRVDIEIPDRKMGIMMTIRRNPDTTLPASHTIEVQFNTPGDPFGGVADMPGIRAKTTEAAQGAPLLGLVVRVLPGFFLVGLSAIESDREQNLTLLRERGWLDIPFVYNNGRRAVLVIEKGNPGDRAVNEAVLAWGG
jgi:hypothetical protein